MVLKIINEIITDFMTSSKLGSKLPTFESETSCATSDARALTAAALTARFGLFAYSLMPSVSLLFSKIVLSRWK